jgi:predicted Rossmann fold nucleotide-binding protein DprA/Smf involved in DNA uptake
MIERLIHVSCVVRDTHVYDLLRALEAHKAGNVEVRPVTPHGNSEQLLLPPPIKRRESYAPHSSVTAKVGAAMALKQKRRVPEIAEETGAKPQSVYSAIGTLMRKGLVKRVETGVYMRIKPDTPPPTEGAQT